MKSKTKYKVSKDTIKQLFEKAEIPNVEHIAPMNSGEFNSVFEAKAGGKDYVIKIAPADKKRILTYEKGMMEQEIYFYSVMKEESHINVPQIYFWDFSHSVIDADYFIMEKIQGERIDKANLTDSQKQTAYKKLAQMTARMHSVKGEKFGYRQNTLHDNWHSALQGMVKDLIKDCARLGKKTKRGQRLLYYVGTYKDTLKKAECSLINFDIWPANIFVKAENDDITLSWIDPERCMWGDRAADFVCLDFMNMDLEKKQAVIADYNEASDNAFKITDDEKVRFAIMLGYLGLIMEVEKYARYSVFNFGYWRNVLVSGMLYRAAFKQLKQKK